MTNEEKKKYLSQVYFIERRIETLLHEKSKVARLLEKCEKVTVSYESDGSQSGSHSNSTENSIINYISEADEYCKKIENELNSLFKAKNRIRQIISLVKNDKAREILYKRYIACLDFRTIRKQMNYSESTTFDYFNLGINEVEIKSE